MEVCESVSSDTINASVAGRAHLKLRPRVDARIDRFLENDKQVFALTRALGSPLHLLFPQNLAPNVAGFRAVLNEHDIPGVIVSTSRVNKSLSVWKSLVLLGCKLDISTEPGLVQALACGAPGSDTLISGPKDAAFLTLAIQQHSIINVDCISELRLIAELWKRLGRSQPVRIFIRLSGFKTAFDATAKDGTFGVHLRELGEALDVVRRSAGVFDLLGFSYHIERLPESDRISVLGQSIQVTRDVRSQGFELPALNMGGGFSVCYLEEKADETEYLSELRKGLNERTARMPWSDNHLGFKDEDGRILDQSKLISHFVPAPKYDHLRVLLNAPNAALPEGTAAAALRKDGLVLYIEPGSALLDQVGCTAAAVSFTKRSNKGYQLVGLDANWSNLQVTQPRLQPDPRVLYRSAKRARCTEGVHFSSNLAISTIDMVHYNQSFPPFLPERGDLAVFFNTGIYRMDFTESRILLHPLPRKVCIMQAEDGFDWFLDDEFNPLEHGLEI